MAELLATMPILPLGSDCTVTFEAIDPTTGATVAGVLISNATIYATDSAGAEQALEVGPFMLVPGPGPEAPAATGAAAYPGRN